MTLYSKIQGITFRNSEPFIKVLLKDEILIFEREPTNSFDKNAIKILDNKKNFLGYIGRPLAEKLAPRIDAGNTFFARVSEVTGGTKDKPNVGCNIEILKQTIFKCTNCTEEVKSEGSECDSCHKLSSGVPNI